MVPVIHVAAGVLIGADGAILLARRNSDAHQGGLWEFPGGKVEGNEQVQQALVRELREELGIIAQDYRPLIEVTHRYADREVVLHTWRVNRWRGEPKGLEGQPLSWVLPEMLDEWPMPAADIPIVKALRLPSVYLITPSSVPDTTQFLTQLKRVLESGISLLQFRVFGLSAAALEGLAQQACRMCHEHGAKMMLNGPLSLAKRINAHGVHLNRRSLMSIRSRDDYGGMLLSASCHDEQELVQAQRIGLDFAVLSPVLPTRSHPDGVALGWGHFADMLKGVSIPVYALGGMNEGHLSKSWQAGAQGIAGIRALWPG